MLWHIPQTMKLWCKIIYAVYFAVRHEVHGKKRWDPDSLEEQRGSHTGQCWRSNLITLAAKCKARCFTTHCSRIQCGPGVGVILNVRLQLPVALTSSRRLVGWNSVWSSRAFQSWGGMNANSLNTFWTEHKGKKWVSVWSLLITAPDWSKFICVE